MNGTMRSHEELLSIEDAEIMRELVVTGRGVGADMDFWCKLGQSSFFLEQVVKYAKGLHGFNNRLSDPPRPSLKLARIILGRDKVISAHQAAKVWGLDQDSRFPIRYSEETLRDCERENAKGKTDWRLIFCNGLSLRKQREIQGVAQEDGQNQPCFRKDSDWWLKSREDRWAKTSPESGYRLVEVKGRFASKGWNQQAMLIAELGEQYERCDEHVFGEVIQTIFMVNNGERIAENWWHWGCSAGSRGSQVLVGGFDRVGLAVSDFRVDIYCSSDVRVCVFRTFDA